LVEQNLMRKTCSDKTYDNMQGASKTIKGIKQKKMHVFQKFIKLAV